MVGDWVEMDIQHDNKAYILDIYERKNYLIRPPISNVDQIFLVLSLKSPELNIFYLDKYLSILERLNVEVVIILNKIDLYSDDNILKFMNIYQDIYHVFLTSTLDERGFADLLPRLKGKVTALSGNSGVGKTSILNYILNADHKVGNISNKTRRGRHTTRNVELFRIEENTYIFDTPGFSAIEIVNIDNTSDLADSFREIVSLKDQCKFRNCLHINEPDCKVKDFFEAHPEKKSRYDSYVRMIKEVEIRSKY